MIETLPILTPDHWDHQNRRYFGVTAAIIAGSIAAAAGSVGAAAIQSHAAGKASDTLSQAGTAAAQGINTATSGAVDYGKQGLDQANGALDLGLVGSTNSVQTGVTDANNAAQFGLEQGNAHLSHLYDLSNGALSPYLDAGKQGISSLASFLGPDGAGMKDFNFQADPGYNFRMAEGQKALERGAAARGGLMGGGFAKALDRYSQDYASNEYGKAFDRYRADRSDKYGMLSGLAGFGQHATDQQVGLNTHLGDALSANEMSTAGRMGDNDFKGGALQSQNWGDWARQRGAAALGGNQYIGNTLLGGAEAAGNNMVGAANGAAAGQMAQGNAWANAFSGSGNALSQMWLLSALSGAPTSAAPVYQPWQNNMANTGNPFGYNGAVGGYQPIVPVQPSPLPTKLG